MLKNIFTLIFLSALVFLVQSVRADDYLASSPVTNVDVIGQANLDKIEVLSYTDRNTWATKLLNNCQITSNIIHDLTAAGNITTLNSGNTAVKVVPGGFSGVNEISQLPQATVDPSYVLKFGSSASQADIAQVDNALGFVLLQGGNVRFSLTDASAFDFPLEYGQIGFSAVPSGDQARAFWAYVGTIDSRLYIGVFAGFTAIDNTLVFLRPDIGNGRFLSGLSQAASTWTGSPSSTYSTLDKQGKPTLFNAGVAFSGNDWVADPAGTGYLSHIVPLSQHLQCQLQILQAQSLQAAHDLLNAINNGKVSQYLNGFNSCPAVSVPGC